MIYAVSQDAEEAFKKTVEVDRLIDLLRHATPHEVSEFCYFSFTELDLPSILLLSNSQVSATLCPCPGWK